MINYFTEFSNNKGPAAIRRRVLKGRTGTFSSLLLAMLVAGLFGCAEFNYHTLESEEAITSTQLRENWNRFIVYHRPSAGLVYKLKNDKKIKMPGKWVAVPNEESIADSKVLYLTDVRKILGQDDVLYGYIVLPSKDSALVKIIDANTVEIIYSHRVQRIGR